MLSSIKPIVLLLLSSLLCSCSRPTPLTLESLQSAEEKWRRSGPDIYRLAVEMNGDRVEPGRFEIAVTGPEVSIRRNGEVVLPPKPQDYSMDGWFRMLHQELDLADNAQLLGAPPGYASYPMALFDPDNGRLVKFQRTVGGTQNSITIDVVDFTPGGQTSRP